MGYSFRLAARILLYAKTHRQDNTYYDLCYISRGALAGKRNNKWKPLFRTMVIFVLCEICTDWINHTIFKKINVLGLRLIACIWPMFVSSVGYVSPFQHVYLFLF